MNTLIEGQDRQLSTMLEEILITGDPDRIGSADGASPSTERMGRADSLSDESSSLLHQEDETSTPRFRKRKPIRGSSSFPNGIPGEAGSLPPLPSDPSGSSLGGRASAIPAVGHGEGEIVALGTWRISWPTPAAEGACSEVRRRCRAGPLDSAISMTLKAHGQ